MFSACSAEEDRDHELLIEDLKSAIERMEGTVNDVLDFRKLESNMFTMNRRVVSLRDLIDNVCRHCRSFLSNGVELQYLVYPSDAMVNVDSRRVFQIITNGLR